MKEGGRGWYSRRCTINLFPQLYRPENNPPGKYHPENKIPRKIPQKKNLWKNPPGNTLLSPASSNIKYHHIWTKRHKIDNIKQSKGSSWNLEILITLYFIYIRAILFTKVSFEIKINAYNNFDEGKPIHYVPCHIWHVNHHDLRFLSLFLYMILEMNYKQYFI